MSRVCSTSALCICLGILLVGYRKGYSAMSRSLTDISQRRSTSYQSPLTQTRRQPDRSPPVLPTTGHCRILPEERDRHSGLLAAHTGRQGEMGERDSGIDQQEAREGYRPGVAQVEFAKGVSGCLACLSKCVSDKLDRDCLAMENPNLQLCPCFARLVEASLKSEAMKSSWKSR